LHFDYTTIGHVTVDVFDDGSRRAGGSAFYSALQAARLGLRTLVITRGRASEIEQLLEPHRSELHLRILPAAHTTTLRTAGSGAQRRQSVLAWAGPIAPDLALDTSILHLAPVARESPGRWRGRAGFVGLTPQGLARQWSAPHGSIVGVQPDRCAVQLARRCHAIVLSEHERASCSRLIAAGAAAGAILAITAGERPTTVLAPHQPALKIRVPAPQRHANDLGAGDVFAAAFFVSLSQGSSPASAARFANAAAGLRLSHASVRAIGTRARIHAQLERSRAPRTRD
jgi:sugar/nucleoside kinase (ribokinase family)